MQVFRVNTFFNFSKRGSGFLLFLILLLKFCVCFAQKTTKDITITGTVSEYETGESIPGANIVVKGTTIGTTTDFDGNFELHIPSFTKGDSVTFSFVGFYNETIALKLCKHKNEGKT